MPGLTQSPIPLLPLLIYFPPQPDSAIPLLKTFQWLSITTKPLRNPYEALYGLASPHLIACLCSLCILHPWGSVPNSPNSPFPASEPIPTGPTAPYPTLHPPLTICHPTSYQSFRPLSTEPFSDAPNKTIRQPIILKTWTFPSQNHPQFVNTYFLESKQKHQGQEKPCLFVHPCIPGA